MFLGPNPVLPPEPVQGVVVLAPAYNVLTTMALLDKPEETADLDDWIMRTAGQMDTALLERHRLIFWGLGFESVANGVELDVSRHTFPAYLAALKTADSTQLRDNIWHNLRHSVHMRVYLDAPLPIPPADLLSSKEAYLTFLIEGLKKVDIPDKEIPYQIHSQAYDLLIDPPALQAMLVEHLDYLWQTFVAKEWARVEPLLQDVVAGFQQIELRQMPIFEMIQAVTRRDLRPFLKEEELLQFRQIQFIPSVHNGPYIMWSGKDDVFRLTFSAYVPQNTTSRSAIQLNQTQLLNRLKALADENRLNILATLRQEGELSTQDIMDRFQLSKSAVSRHLRQLTANTLIVERRVEDGVKKFYRLNSDSGIRVIAGLADLFQKE